MSANEKLEAALGPLVPEVWTEGERSVMLKALNDMRFETERYVSSTAPTSAHDSCCEADRGRRQVMDEMHAAMLDRLATVNDLIQRFEAGR